MAAAARTLVPTRFRDQAWYDHANRMISASLDAVDPCQAVKNHLRRAKNKLLLDDIQIKIPESGNIYLIAFGKAAPGMARGVLERLNDRPVRGCIISKIGQAVNLPSIPNEIQILPAEHPVPGPSGIHAAREVISLLRQTTPQDLVIFSISGGGSTLLTAPLEGITLTDLAQLNRLLLSCGADINQINTLRKHLSRVKGGRLQKLAFPAQTISLILSDVIGNPLASIASGPTAPDPTTYNDALDILTGYELTSRVPSSILKLLQAGEKGQLSETPKPGHPIFLNTAHVIVADNRQALAAGLAEAVRCGYTARAYKEPLSGKAHETGAHLGKYLIGQRAQLKTYQEPFCMIAGGETIVQLGEQPVGLGGRNLEVALGAVQPLSGSNAVFISFATDGEDGPTNAAGAVVTGETEKRAGASGLSAVDYLSRHDSYHYFQRLGNLLLSGPTGTNVNDLVFMFLH